MGKVIRIGSRESDLAVRQAELIRDQICLADPGAEVQIITMKTTGDRILDRGLEKIGGRGLFVKELDEALTQGKIDLAVHSLKDMPMEVPEEFPILAFSRREDPRDVLVFSSGELPEAPVIGTSSRRRELQLRRIFPDCSFRGIRGNVRTRIRKLETEGYDAAVLAAAGLKRLGLESRIGRYFSVAEMIPAAGQGILAVQGRKEQREWQLPDDPDSRDAATAERSFIRTLGGGCTSPSAAYAEIKGNELRLTGLCYDEESDTCVVDSICAERTRAGSAGESLALSLMRRF